MVSLAGLAELPVNSSKPNNVSMDLGTFPDAGEDTRSKFDLVLLQPALPEVFRRKRMWVSLKPVRQRR